MRVKISHKNTNKALRLFAIGAVLLLSACGSTTMVEQSKSESVGEVSPDEATRTEGSPHTLLASSGDVAADVIVRPVDPQTLADLPGYEPIALGDHYNAMLSEDGRRWAVATWSESGQANGTLRVIDTVGWEDTAIDLDLFGYVSVLAFSPDGSRLVLSQEEWSNVRVAATLIFIDVDAQETANRVDVPLVPRQARFSEDGQTLYVYGVTADPQTNEALPPKVAAFDVSSGDTLWTKTLDNVRDGFFFDSTDDEPSLALNPHQPNVSHYVPGVAFGPDGRWLYVVHADAERMTAVNLSTGEARAQRITGPRTWFESLLYATAHPAQAKGPVSGAEKRAALSPDGTRLYVTGLETEVAALEASEINEDGAFPEVAQRPLGLVVIDTQTGRRLAGMETEMVLARPSPDGQYLYLTQGWAPILGPNDAIQGDAWLHIVQANTLDVLAEVEVRAGRVEVFTAPNRDEVYYVTHHTDSPTFGLHLLDVERGRPELTRKVTGWHVQLIVPPG